jgi:hypothetical protein
VAQINVVQGEQKEPLYSFLLTPSGQRFGESLERDFERSVRYAEGRIEAEDVNMADLKRHPPTTIAAYYAVLAREGDSRAEEVRVLYKEESERRARLPASVELEERAPGTSEVFSSFYWQMVERYAQSPGESSPDA